MTDNTNKLDLNNLEAVNGGSAMDDDMSPTVNEAKTIRAACNSSICKGAIREFVVASGGRATCTKCREIMFL